MVAMTGERRVETDSLGLIEVPAGAYWGASTERARRNFQVSGLRLAPRFVRALALIKREAVAVNQELGLVPREIADAIGAVAQEIVDGRHADQFPLDVFQTGSGTSTNMNANEVIANLAIERLGGALGSKRPVHPNDHVNASQSSNDVIPTALHVAAYGAVAEELEPALRGLAATLAGRAQDFDGLVKIGRTHLQDAVPIRLGQEFSGYARQVGNGVARLDAALPRLAELALGGTAVGTGLNAPPGFADRVIERLARSTGHPFVPAPNRFEAMAARDAAVEASGALKTVALSLTKIASDLRWMGSGPRCGLGEITLPSLQPGSSIMPGKVNPVIPESVLQVAAQVIGNDAAITIAGTGGLGGNFELNTMMPLMAYDLLQSIEILARVAVSFDRDCVKGISANEERMRELVERSLAMVTALVPRIGYDAATALAKEAFSSGKTVRELALQRKLLPAGELDAILDPSRMTEGGVRGGE
jgi:fumarate hydratase, class II